MVDFGQNKVFKASAFEPTDEELTNHARETRRAKGARRRGVRMRSPTPEKTFEDRGLDDSDDDFPDVSTILDKRPAKRQKKSKGVDSDGEDDEKLTELTMDQISKPLRDIKMGSMSDSEIKFIDPVDTKRKRDASASPDKGKAKAKTPTKKHARDGREPTDALIATWRRGDDDLEPSAKMLALIDLLQEWESTGDKTIVYSQWTSMLDLLEILFARHGIQSLRFDGKMDRVARDQVLSTFKKPGGPKNAATPRCESRSLEWLLLLQRRMGRPKALRPEEPAETLQGSDDKPSASVGSLLGVRVAMLYSY
ncbi:hypothetical protein C0991_006327 [Blastosporella zonata]|nr:hypothetical protein C0991_006327 [Blastosporella zonata]